MSTTHLADVAPIAHERKTETIVREHLHATFDCPVCGTHHDDVRLYRASASIDREGVMLEEYMVACKPCRSGIFLVMQNGVLRLDRADTPPNGMTF